METNTEKRCVTSLHEYRILETEYQMPDGDHDGDVSWHRCADWLELERDGVRSLPSKLGDVVAGIPTNVFTQ